jgi:tRNA 2-thiouridine synthesizing protein A
MQTFRIDTCGLRCPQPILLLASRTAETAAGTIVEVLGDCPTFETDVRTWCERKGKTILAVLGQEPKLCIQVRF